MGLSGIPHRATAASPSSKPSAQGGHQLQAIIDRVVRSERVSDQRAREFLFMATASHRQALVALNSEINRLTARHDECDAMAARRCSAMTISTSASTLRAAAKSTTSSARRGPLGTGLVSGAQGLHFEFSPVKTGKKSAPERLYRSLAVGFTPAAFNAASASESRHFGVWAKVTSALGQAPCQRTLGDQ